MGKRMPDIRIPCDRATELTGQGRFDEAILVMNSVIRTDSNNRNIWYNKGLILYKQPLLPVFTVPVTGLPAETSRQYSPGPSLPLMLHALGQPLAHPAQLGRDLQRVKDGFDEGRLA